MHPTLIARPVHHEGWVYEEEVDGYRVLADKAGECVRLISRHAKDLTARFPELVQAIASLRPETLVLDGEVAVYDEQLVSRFEWMRRPPTGSVATPPMMMVFDLLRLEGRTCGMSRSASGAIVSSGCLAARPRSCSQCAGWRITA